MNVRTETLGLLIYGVSRTRERGARPRQTLIYDPCREYLYAAPITAPK